MRRFVGERDGRGRCRVYVEDGPDRSGRRRLQHRAGLHRFTLNTFEWGKGPDESGHGRRALAHALVVAVTGESEPNPRVTQTFEVLVVHSLPAQRWTLDEQEVRTAFNIACVMAAQTEGIGG